MGKLGLASKADFSKVYLIDMGFARPVPTDAEEHHLDGFLGTPSFASERAFKGLRCTRACDMEGLGYCLLEIYTGESSWDLICPDPTQPVSINICYCRLDAAAVPLLCCVPLDMMPAISSRCRETMLGKADSTVA
jgi:hypothetical protein